MSDPDQTTRIPKESLEGFRGSDPDKAREASRSGSSPHESPSSPNGSPGASSGGYSSDGSVSPSGTTRSSLFRSGTGGSGAGAGAAATGAGANGVGGYRSDSGPAAAPPVSSPIGYPERSQTGYSPAAYQGSYSSAYPSLADAPTSVAGRGVGRAGAVGAGAGAAAAARASLSAAARPSPGARGAPGGRPPRRARLLVRHIDPWSTLKFSFVLSVAMFFVWLVAVGVLYGVLDGMGVFSQINKLYDEVSGNAGDRLFSPALVLGSATVVGAVNIVLFTALATIGAFVYNICSDLVGGIEVTLAERD